MRWNLLESFSICSQLMKNKINGLKICFKSPLSLSFCSKNKLVESFLQMDKTASYDFGYIGWGGSSNIGNKLGNSYILFMTDTNDSASFSRKNSIGQFSSLKEARSSSEPPPRARTM